MNPPKVNIGQKLDDFSKLDTCLAFAFGFHPLYTKGRLPKWVKKNFSFCFLFSEYYRLHDNGFKWGSKGSLQNLMV